jgi:hypothetical protein
MFFSIHSFAILTAKFSASASVANRSFGTGLGGTGRLGDGCHSRPVAVVHLLGRDGDVVASIGWDHLSLNHRVTSSKSYS